MDAKEAINILAKMQNYDSKRNVEALEIAISALEKVPVLEVENAKGFTYHFPFKLNQKAWWVTAWDKYSLQKHHAGSIRQIHIDDRGITFDVSDGPNYHSFSLKDIGMNVFLSKKDWRNARIKLICGQAIKNDKE